MSEGSGNGEGTKPVRITATMDPVTCHLDLNIEAPSVDVALMVLERAVRHVEARFRMELAQAQVQAQFAKRQEAAIRETLAKGRQS